MVWDPEKRHELSAASHHSNVDYNLFEGTEVTGGPELVLVRGQVIVAERRVIACSPAQGSSFKRARFGEELTSRTVVAWMSDERAHQIYAEAGLGQQLSLGVRPAVLVIDFSCGFTDPDCRLGWT